MTFHKLSETRRERVEVDLANGAGSLRNWKDGGMYVQNINLDTLPETNIHSP